MAVIETRAVGRRRRVVPRAVRRPDAAQARAGAAGRRRQDPRHVARLDRPRRGSRALRGAAVGAGHPAAGERHGDVARGSARRRGAHRLPGRRAAVVRARRPRHGDRLRRRHARSLHDAAPSTRRPSIRCSIDKFLEDAFEFDVDAVADATGAVVIGGIMEHIEEAGIHSGDSSCVVPPFICRRAAPRDDPRLHAAHRARAEGRRPDERAVRDQGRRGLRARGESARVAHRAVSVEGDRRAAGEDRGAGDGRADARASSG